MAKDSIRLSEKYGVNPSMIICPICGNVTSIGLLGKLKDDAKAPIYIAGDICEDCIEKLEDDKVYIIAIDDNNNPIKWIMINKNIINKEITYKVVLMQLIEFNTVFKDS